MHHALLSLPLRHVVSRQLPTVVRKSTRLSTASTHRAAPAARAAAEGATFGAASPLPACSSSRQLQSRNPLVFFPSRGHSSVGNSALLITSNRSAEGLVPVGKLLAERGVCSRGEGDEFFSLGLVLLDGRRLERNEAYVHPDAPVQLAPRAERLMQRKVTVLLHKPMHFLSCQTDKQARCGGGKPLSQSLLSPENHWGPFDGLSLLDARRCKKLVAAGRLDADSSGLQVLTQDGRIAAQLIGGRGESVVKEYIVQVDVPPSEGALTLLRSGLSLDGYELLPAVVKSVPQDVGRRLVDGVTSDAVCISSEPSGRTLPSQQPSVFFSIELREGRNRQIRRMCELVGLRALRVHRIRIGNISLGSLPPGRWRHLLKGERFS